MRSVSCIVLVVLHLIDDLLIVFVLSQQMRSSATS